MSSDRQQYDLPSWISRGLADGSIDLEWDSTVDRVNLVYRDGRRELLPLAHRLTTSQRSMTISMIVVRNPGT